MISGRDQSRADDVIQPLSALRHLQTSGSAGLSTFAFRRGIQSCGLSAPLSIISRFRFSTRNMGEDLDLFGLPDSRSSALRAGKDISFGSVSQSSHFKKRRRFANWTDLNFFFSRLQELYQKYSSIRSTSVRSGCRHKFSIRLPGSVGQSTA